MCNSINNLFLHRVDNEVRGTLTQAFRISISSIALNCQFFDLCSWEYFMPLCRYLLTLTLLVQQQQHNNYGGQHEKCKFVYLHHSIRARIVRYDTMRLKESVPTTNSSSISKTWFQMKRADNKRHPKNNKNDLCKVWTLGVEQQDILHTFPYVHFFYVYELKLRVGLKLQVRRVLKI